jgi:hypothetical protein
MCRERKQAAAPKQEQHHAAAVARSNINAEGLRLRITRPSSEQRLASSVTLHTHSLTLAPHAVSSSQSEREQHGRGAVRGVRADGQARGRTREAHDGQGRAATLGVAQVPQVKQKVRVPQERAASLWQQAAAACGCGQQSHRGPAAGRGQPQTLQGGHRVGVGQQSVPGGTQQSLQQHQPSQ